MAKVSGSYESVVRGVSEQTPHDRRSGQHYEQVNMVSDPVRGNSRRHGSRLLAEAYVASGGAYPTLLADTASHRTYTFYIQGVEYDLITRTEPAPSGAGAASFLWAFNRAAGQFLPVVTSPADPTLNALVAGGVSAAVSIGRYIYLAGNTITPLYTATDHHGEAGNRSKAVAWIRGGAYSRTFKVTLTLEDGSKIVGQYKTVAASYPELLDTSDILSSDPDYSKKVNDRVHYYNSQTTQWIGIAAEDITPENIASSIAADLTAKGALAVSVRNGTVCVADSRVVEISGDDGGDGSLIRAVGHEVKNVDEVSTIHWAGRIVKVKPKRGKGDDALYLKAVPDDADATGFTEVNWRECAGYTMQPDIVFAMATVKGGKLYIAGTPAKLEALTGLVVPGYRANEVGDGLTSPLPSFFGRKITYLGQFQDRLVIGAGATVFMSRPGDYLNFWRQSVLTVLDTDPVEVYALGAEDDTISFGVTFDRDLILYGKRFQYAISGRTPMTPKTASIVAASAYKDASDAAPKASGNFVFYAKYARVGTAFKTSMHQVSAGQLQEQPESYEISQQLDGYLRGKPVEIVTLASPNMVALRTDGNRYGLYTYTYLDGSNNTERLFDSWSRWSWHTELGALAGVTAYEGGMIAYMLRVRGDQVLIAAEKFTVESSLSSLPYADSLQPLADAEASPAMVGTTGAIVALARDGGPHQLMGQSYAALDTFKNLYPTELSRAWVGFHYDAYTTPTNPYIRDSQGNAILNGRFTLSKVVVSVADTAGLRVVVGSHNDSRIALDFNGRIVGASSFTLGEQPIVTTDLPAFIGREIRDCTYSLQAKGWLPLTITNIEWTGQVFSRTRRV